MTLDAGGRTPLQYARIDTHAPSPAAIRYQHEARFAQTRQWADDQQNSAPKPTEEELAAERKKYEQRQEEIKANYDAVQRGEMQHPSGVSPERLKLAVEGDPNSTQWNSATGERIPLTFGMDPDEAKKLFHQFQGELQAVLQKHGISDAVVQQLGSSTTGWRGNPKKEIAGWKPSGDVDFAIFSDQILEKARLAKVPVNENVTQGGQYTVLKNEKGGLGFMEATEVGKDLRRLARDWDKKLWPDEGGSVEHFDFKLNLTNKPFSRAVTVVQNEPVLPLTSPSRAEPLVGRSPFFGVRVMEPKMGDRIQEGIVETREHHITIFEPDEWAALPAAARKELEAGIVLGGTPRGTGMTRTGSRGTYTMTVDWPEANALRAKYGLGPKALHVTIGKSSGARGPAAGGDMPELQD
jgi:hypothetical protein